MAWTVEVGGSNSVYMDVSESAMLLHLRKKILC